MDACSESLCGFGKESKIRNSQPPSHEYSKDPRFEATDDTSKDSIHR